MSANLGVTVAGCQHFGDDGEEMTVRDHDSPVDDAFWDWLDNRDLLDLTGQDISGVGGNCKHWIRPHWHPV